jgi:cobalt-zinc-cadmium resistance protein CzcA
MNKLLELAIARRWTVLIASMAIAGFGVWAFFQQPIDAYPDISAQVVQIRTTFPGRATEEVERQVTVPLEIALRSVPNLESIRSRTIFGLSDVRLVFEEGIDGYWARQRVLEKLASVDLPEGASAELGPYATAYGEVYRYELVGDDSTDLMQLRELNDWMVIPRLMRASGVAEVSNFGGFLKQFTIELMPEQLKRFNLTFDDIVKAIEVNNSVAGGSVMIRGGTSYVIRGTGAVENILEIQNVFVKSVSGTGIFLKDIGRVKLDHAVQMGIFSKDDVHESVEGIVLMRRGENPTEVLKAVQLAMDDLNTNLLPDEVRLVPFYNRQVLVDSTLETVAHSVSLGITLVLLVLILFFGRPSIAILVAATVPFSLLFALVLMYFTKIPIGLLSIGAIDFGIIVDGAIIMAEYLAHRLSKQEGNQENVERRVLHAASQIALPVFFSVIMVIIAYLPLLSLQRIEGLLFRPMALTMAYALIGALFFALFVVPGMMVIMYPKGYREPTNIVLDFLTHRYGLVVSQLLRLRWLVLACSILLVAFVSVRVVPRLGFEFLPYMDEGVIWVRANFPEGTALEQTSAFAERIREIALEFEDVSFVSCQAGRNDSGTDPFPSSRLETMIGPKPMSQWKEFDNKQALIQELGRRLRREFPTTRFNFTQPIIDSVTEDTNGTSANLAIEISGANPKVLAELAERSRELLASVRGAIDVSIEQEGPQPQLIIAPDRAKCAQNNVRIQDVTNIINTAIGGQPIGKLFEGERRFDIVARFSRERLSSPEALGRIPIFTQDGRTVPLSQVADITIKDGQTLIARQDGVRRLTVRCDIQGRDQGGFVEDAQREFRSQIKVPDGYTIAWLGMFENLTRAKQHFMIAMPITILLIYILLYATFKSQKAALLLLASVPFAFVGAVLGLYLRSMNFNVSTAVGFAALFGVSIMNGVLMVRSIAESQSNGQPLQDAIILGSRNCLRPILLASLVAVLGLLPASLAQGLGSDIQRPLATVIVYGLTSAALLTLFVVPVLYHLVQPKIHIQSNHSV